MKLNTFLVSALLLTSLSSKLFAEDPISICMVQQVFTGVKATFILVKNCKGQLNFTEKTFELAHHRMAEVESRTGSNSVFIDRIDTTADVLGMKSTAELAMMFQKPVRIQMETPNSENIVFISLADTVDLSSNGEWKPTPAPKPRSHAR